MEAGVGAIDSTSETSGFEMLLSPNPETIVAVVNEVVRVADGDRVLAGDLEPAITVLRAARGESVSDSRESTSAASMSWPDSSPVSTKSVSGPARTRPVRVDALVARNVLRAVVSVGWNGVENFVEGGRVRQLERKGIELITAW